MINIREIPVLDLDFDDIEELYKDTEADCVGDLDEDLPLANDREQALYDFWMAWDERFQDKLTRRSK